MRARPLRKHSKGWIYEKSSISYTYYLAMGARLFSILVGVHDNARKLLKGDHMDENYVPLTDDMEAEKMLRKAKAQPFDKVTLTRFLEYVYFLSASDITPARFADSARAAANKFEQS